MRKAAKILSLFGGAALLSACVPRTPSVSVDQRDDGRIVISVTPEDSCVISVAIAEVARGPRERDVWALVQYPPSHASCRSQFVFPEVPGGYYEWPSSAEVTRQLIAGREYEVEVDGGAFHGEARFVRDEVEAVTE